LSVFCSAAIRAHRRHHLQVARGRAGARTAHPLQHHGEPVEPWLQCAAVLRRAQDGGEYAARIATPVLSLSKHGCCARPPLRQPQGEDGDRGPWRAGQSWS